ncbi:hypothetical protein CB1_000172021 [Camelus ferus]|nr:hypothetical protein CB1_000172021 [Camelus ferus]
MELLSALSLGELALSFSRVPLFPVFDLSYFIVSIIYLKYEPGSEKVTPVPPSPLWLRVKLLSLPWAEAVLDLRARREFFQLWPGSFPLTEQYRP